jgi:hypothetical protein
VRSCHAIEFALNLQKNVGTTGRFLNRNSVEKSEGNTNNGRLGFFMIISDFLFLYIILKFSVIGAYLLH